jgi:D-glycero-D-manno-heptose 1,7-bisphosphate phosphatase
VTPTADGSRRAVFLDRDGVLNATIWDGRTGRPPAKLEELRILPGVEDALQRLRVAGFRLIVVTNQPDVVRQITAREQVDAINARLLSSLPLNAIEVCFHDDADACGCRKPAPGMLVDAARRDGIDLTRSFMVGDRWRDIEAGNRAGCVSILVNNDHLEPVVASVWKRVESLAEAADAILESGSTGLDD